jgi:hypothetical protein
VCSQVILAVSTDICGMIFPYHVMRCGPNLVIF